MAPTSSSASASGTGGLVRGSGSTGTAAATTTTRGGAIAPSPHAPSLAGSVVETSDGTLIRIQNISCTANLGVRLDLKKIALKCRNTEFNPRRFGACIMRLREPKATALIFASGKMCITGIKSAHNATLATKKFTYIVEKVGFKPNKLVDFTVQNIVGTTDVGFPIRLEGLVYAHSTFASYEPELFPGLIYRLVNPRVVFLIFVSGKIVITGAKTESALTEAFEKLYPVLMQYGKVHVASLPDSTTGQGKQQTTTGNSSSNIGRSSGGGLESQRESAEV